MANVEPIVKPKGKGNTIWSKLANEYLIAEIAIGEPTRCCDYAKMGHGQSAIFWAEIAKALQDRIDAFPDSTHPSSRVCQLQFDKLLLQQRKNFADHKWQSGSTEDVGEVASGLEEIMKEIDEQSDLKNAGKFNNDLIYNCCQL